MEQDCYAFIQALEILQKQQPRRLLGIVQLGRASRLFPQHVINILKRLFEHQPRQLRTLSPKRLH
jgi:hypothetical protein